MFVESRATPWEGQKSPSSFVRSSSSQRRSGTCVCAQGWNKCFPLRSTALPLLKTQQQPTQRAAAAGGSLAKSPPPAHLNEREIMGGERSLPSPSPSQREPGQILKQIKDRSNRKCHVRHTVHMARNTRFAKIGNKDNRICNSHQYR